MTLALHSRNRSVALAVETAINRQEKFGRIVERRSYNQQDYDRLLANANALMPTCLSKLIFLDESRRKIAALLRDAATLMANRRYDF